ncbi:UDP-glucose 4-epimerase Gal10 [Metarhizium album ARSEF 1941]|uniref:UDP-glucose 4-epimerase Gal10 n=1 Tax=Metarhizium album (strain ARSEF 1941) TaxID=1081103 RepID=A0A0B2X0X3_METAS|nr:UDP-glucose 4-epimerase Gal10 [Metarhizium album ARSEF 1941]KHN99287.1 UDP-glucose 4-epimerase Gal10 [Metarhizium album ARSEF 1941]
MSGGGGDATLFEESFTVTDYDQSKYDRVARISCTSADSQTVMVLDINMELFPVARSDSLHVVLSTTLSPDGSKEDDKGWRDVGKGGDAPATLADLYDYVCYGKIYKFEETYDGNTMYVLEHLVSFPARYLFSQNAIITAVFDAFESLSCSPHHSPLTIDWIISNAYVSFGGLLMSLQGPVKKLTPLRVDNIYLLIKK